MAIKERLEFLARKILEGIDTDTVYQTREENMGRRLEGMINILNLQKFLVMTNRHYFSNVLSKIQSFVSYEQKDLFTETERSFIYEQIGTYDTSSVLREESITQTKRVIKGYLSF